MGEEEKRTNQPLPRPKPSSDALSAAVQAVLAAAGALGVSNAPIDEWWRRSSLRWLRRE